LNLTTNTVKKLFAFIHLSKTFVFACPKRRNKKFPRPLTRHGHATERRAQELWRAERFTRRHALGTILLFLVFVSDIWYNPTGTF
jgi:hypothetical protein